MGTFTPIAMRCTQEQFNAVKPKLKGLKIEYISSFSYHNYLVNNLGEESKLITNITEFTKEEYNRTVYEEWNEEIFLKACGIEVDSLEQQLQKAEAEVNRLKYLIEKENRPKVGDWVKNKSNQIFKYCNWMAFSLTWIKINDQELINKLNELIK